MKTALRRLNTLAAFSLALVLAPAAGPATAEEIVVSNYGVSANGMPYAVALEKSFLPCATTSRSASGA
jgi:NitT/TauT family transport system substrate-binding protein